MFCFFIFVRKHDNMTNIHKLFYFILLVNLSANAQLNLGIGVGHQYGLGFGSRLGYKLGENGHLDHPKTEYVDQLFSFV